MPSIKKSRKHLNKLHKRVPQIVIFIVALLVAIPFLVFLRSAQASSNWDLTGAYTLNFTCTSVCSGSYEHIMNITSMDMATGNFSGNGFYTADNNFKWQITGSVKDSGLTFHIFYTEGNLGYTIDGNGTILDNGSMSGTASSSSGQAFNFNSISGSAKPVTKDICRKEGWTSLGSKNQGQCTKNFNLHN